MENIYRPEILNLKSSKDNARYEALLGADPNIFIFDTIEAQLRELIKVRHPDQNPSEDEYVALIQRQLKGENVREYGVWVYFAWSRRIVHVLPEEEFIEVRTNRNQLKITREEQLLLKEKIVGVIGLSVGQSIALTIAMERVCGTIRLADYDFVELSNLNRIRTGIHNLDVSKVVIAAREIAEIDPFMHVEVFRDGLNMQNMEDFISGKRKLDVMVEVCDNLEIKLKSRIAARAHGVPVVMETNDRCMLDIERFDLDPNRPILHGLVSSQDVENIADLPGKERLNLVLKIVDGDQLSDRMKQSFGEIGTTLRAWPQLASSVTLGGGITTEVVRKVLLNENIESGRCYFDVEQILLEKTQYK